MLSRPVAFVALLIASLAACGSDPKRGEPAPSPEVFTRVLEPTPVGELSLRGTVTSATRLPLAFKTSGVLAGVSVKRGERVRKGQVLATLADQGSSAALRAAEQRRAHARRELGTVTVLVESGSVATAHLERARVEVLAAEAECALAAQAVAGLRLASPVGGTVWQRAVEPGQFVAAGSPALVIDETSRLVIRAAARQDDLPRVRDGGSITVSVGEGAPALAADLLSVAPAPGADGLYEVEVGPRGEGEAAGLVPGAAATVRFESARPATAMRVPSDALVYRDERPLVWVVTGGEGGEGGESRVSGREVDVERYEGRDVVVRAGLRPGERVVTEGGYFFHNGQAVRVAP